MRKDDFLNFPIDDYCSTILSLGQPRSGKTFVMLKCVEQWLKMGMFDEYHMVLPAFKNEADGSYDWLLNYDNVYVYEKYYDRIGNTLIKTAMENDEKWKKKKIPKKPRIFFCVDDATSEGKMFQSESLRALATKNRHLNITSWFLSHYCKGVLDPKVRMNIKYIFLYPVKSKLLKMVWEDFIDFQEFDDFKKEFMPFWREYITPKKYGVLLVNGRESYNPMVDSWFSEK